MIDFRSDVQDAVELANWIGEQVDGITVGADDRTRVAAALISISLGHHAGIVELFRTSRDAQALALIRSMIDCFVRSQWVAHLASDEQIPGFIGGDDPPSSTPKLAKKLEEQGFYDSGLLTGIIGRVWAVVCDFNQGGGRMVVRHLSETNIAPTFEPEELAEALTASNAWALVAASALADLAGSAALQEALLKKGADLAKEQTVAT